MPLRIVGFILVGLLAVVSAYGADQWVFLGDSITVGMIGDGRSFVAEVHGRYGVEIAAVNTSRVGKHVTEYVREIDGILRRYPQARYFPFLIGGNDVRQFSQQRARWLQGKLVTVLDKIVAAGRIPILMRMTYRRTDGDPRGRYNTVVYDPLVRQYSPRWFDNGSGRGLLDVHGWVQAHQQYLARDGVHLSRTGYRLARQELLVQRMAGVVYGTTGQGNEVGLLHQTPDSVTGQASAPGPLPTAGSAPQQSAGHTAGTSSEPRTVQSAELGPEQLQLQATLACALACHTVRDRAFLLSCAYSQLEELLQAGVDGEALAQETSQLQQALSEFGLDVKPIDGICGPRTRRAGRKLMVALAQSHVQQLGFSPGPIDGIEGPRTRAALAAYWASRGSNRPGSDVTIAELALLRVGSTLD